MIPTLSPVAVTPHPLNERLWELVRKEADGLATSGDLTELNAMFRSLETGQDSRFHNINEEAK